MPGKLPQGLFWCLSRTRTHTHKDKRHLALRHCVSLRAVLTPRSLSFSFQMERYEWGGECEIKIERWHGGKVVLQQKKKKKGRKEISDEWFILKEQEERKERTKQEKSHNFPQPPFLYYSNSTHPCFLSFAPSASNNQVYQPPLFYLCLSISVSPKPISCAIHFPSLICANPCCAAVLFMCYTSHLSTLSLFSSPFDPTSPSLSAILNVLFHLLYCADG